MHFWRQLILGVLAVLSLGRGEAAGPAPTSAVQVLLEQSRRLNMLAIGERHGSIAEHAFLNNLVGDPDFPSVFPVIVVEFGNAHYQDVVDRYMAGEEVPSQELSKIWQNTTVPMAWDSPLYAAFFQKVRDLNRRAPKDKKLCILLGDPPVDWSKVNSVADFEPYEDRDAFYAGVMARNCGVRRCLLICGTNHFYWKDPLSGLRPPSRHKNALEYYIAKSGDRGKIESVLALFSRDKTLAAKGAPALFSTRKPPLETMRFGQVDQSSVTILKKVNGELKPVEVHPENTLVISEVVDWVLYLGETEEKSAPRTSLYQDKAYIRELYRRAKIVGDAFGFDMTSDVKEVDPDAKR